jgi:hypothetical protein
MSETARLSGQCLCGAVKFTAAPEKHEMGVCHCEMCRRWAGGALMLVRCGDTVKIEDERALGVYQSSDWAERCFCKVCGSTLFWRARNRNFAAASAQAFEHPEMFAFVREIFIDEKPANYAFANDTTKRTGAEMMAKYAPRPQ